MSVTNLKIQYLIVILIHVYGFCYAQSSKYNFSFQDAGLEEVIHEVSRQSKINILYNPNILPANIRTSGSFKNLTLKQALDTFLYQTQILYKFYKRDIVLYKKTEEIKETHQIFKSEPQKKTGSDKVVQIITDTVTYALITQDTIITKLTTYEKVPVMDTINVYDTIEVVKKVFKPTNEYKPKQESLITGIYLGQSVVFSNVYLNEPKKDSTGIIKSSLREKQGNGFGLNIIYHNKKVMIETGIGLSKIKYTFNYTYPLINYVTILDTIDKYYTNVTGTDTTWVYVTEEKQQKQLTERIYLSDLVYHYITIPLIGGYTITKKNYTFEFKGGVSFSLYTGSRGSYLNISPDNKLIVENSKGPNAIAFLNAFAALGVDYYLNKDFHIFAQPCVNWTMIPLVKNKTNYHMKDLQIGLQLGIRYYF